MTLLEEYFNFFGLFIILAIIVTTTIFLIALLGTIGPLSLIWGNNHGCQITNFTQTSNFGECLTSGVVLIAVIIIAILVAISVYCLNKWYKINVEYASVNENF